MKQILSLFRVAEWYDSKIPLIIVIYMYCYQKDGDGLPFSKGFGAIFVFSFLFYAVNYLINDYADLEIDRLAGKKKVIQLYSKRAVFILICSIALLATVLLLAMTGVRIATAIMLLLSWFLGASYSVPGLRMKERGIWGVIVASFAQRNCCILVLATIVPISPLVFTLWMVLSFANGIRYILIHQYIDLENDIKTGTSTFVRGRVWQSKRAIDLALALELLCLVLLFFGYLRAHLLPCLFALLYLLLMLLNRYFVSRVLEESYWYSFANVPLEDLYNAFLPMAMTLAMLRQQESLWIAVACLIYLLPTLRKKLYMPYMSLRKLLETRNV